MSQTLDEKFHDVLVPDSEKYRTRLFIHPELNVNGITSKKQALAIVVSLSAPSKMPCYGYSISAFKCITGSKLRLEPNSTCSACYALKGWYPRRKIIQETYEKRLQAISNPQWVDAMVFMIKYYDMKYFRWHDSGDLQSVGHLEKIVSIAAATPTTWHWLPTREYGFVNDFWEKHGKIPLNKLIPNLIIRLSASTVNQKAPYGLAQKVGCLVSEVRTEGYTCPAKENIVVTRSGQKKEQNGFCGSCRNCFDPDIFVVSYPLH